MTDTTTGGHPLTYPSQGDPVSPATSWDSVMDTFMQDLSDHLDALGTSNITRIDDANEEQILTFAEVASAVNYLEISNAATTGNVSIAAQSASGNFGIELKPKGSGAIVLDSYTWPSADGLVGQTIQTDGSGNLSMGPFAGDSLAADLSPQLGGNLDTQSFKILDDILPTTDETWDLGSSSKVFGNLYADTILPKAGSTITAGGFNINTGSTGDITCDTVTANYNNFGNDFLTVYDVGTFTPTIRGTSTEGAGTYVAQNGSYTIIGDLCYFQAYVSWTNLTSASGDLSVGGLPVASKNTTNLQSIGSAITSNMDWNNSSNSHVTIIIQNNRQYMEFRTTDDAATNSVVPIDTSGVIQVSGVYKTV